MSLILMGMTTNLRPIADTSAWLGDDVFYVKGDHIIPAALMDIEFIGGKLCPVIQYLNSDGEIYSVKDRPEHFEAMIVVDESDLMVA